MNRKFPEEPEGKSPPRRSKSRWEANIKIDLMEIGWECGLDSSSSV
jgi:hypothetical protein